MTKYDSYMADVTEDITEIVQQFGTQPILFIGSGLSKRYFGAPNWEELLILLANKCSEIDKGIGFYKQSFGSPISIGEEFADLYQKWAWGAGHNEFPDTMFGADIGKADYIKFQIAEHIRSLTPDNLAALQSSGYSDEIDALRRIKPHAIITTNYDTMIEVLFPDLTPVIGQTILKGQNFTIGEIYKIHGDVTEPSKIVFTASDYADFSRRKKFLSAKLLTFFNEHPLIFIGYSATDPNIRAILSDIDEALPEKGGIIPNVYILDWLKDVDPSSSPAHEKIIETEEGRSVRVKLIGAHDFSWVFQAFAANPVLNNVSPRVLRSLLARSYELVRHDIPRMKVEADFAMLTERVATSEGFAKLFGIATISDFSAASAHHRFTATQVAKALGSQTWHITNKMIDKLKNATGFDIKASDNIYHRTELMNTTPYQKYSQDAIDLLKKVQEDLPYELKM